MRRRDKLKNIEQANLMLEQSYLKSKGFLKKTSINEGWDDYNATGWQSRLKEIAKEKLEEF